MGPGYTHTRKLLLPSKPRRYASAMEHREGRGPHRRWTAKSDDWFAARLRFQCGQGSFTLDSGNDLRPSHRDGWQAWPPYRARGTAFYSRAPEYSEHRLAGPCSVAHK